MCDWQRLWCYVTLQYGLDPIRNPHARHLECWWAQSNKGSSHWKKNIVYSYAAKMQGGNTLD